MECAFFSHKYKTPRTLCIIYKHFTLDANLIPLDDCLFQTRANSSQQSYRLPVFDDISKVIGILSRDASMPTFIKRPDTFLVKIDAVAFVPEFQISNKLLLFKESTVKTHQVTYHSSFTEDELSNQRSLLISMLQLDKFCSCRCISNLDFSLLRYVEKNLCKVSSDFVHIF